MTDLLLASSSKYRRQLLGKLQLSFRCQSPDIDETALAGETPQQLVQRLSITKAQALATDNPNCLIIGSDQVACLGGRIIGKPGNKANAIKQLSDFSGNSAIFYTGLCLLNSNTHKWQAVVTLFEVEFNQLSQSQINNYLDQEQPYDCAGSFKSEGLGISLFKALKGDDPNSLIGLPLIKLCEFLRQEGIEPLKGKS